MNKTIKTLLLVLAIVSLLALSAFGYRALKDKAGLENLAEDAGGGQNEQGGDAAVPIEVPDFTAMDSDGNEVTLSSLRGKPVVLNFWATWCGYCRREMPDFETVYKEFRDEVHFVMLNATDEASGETVDKAKGFIAESGFTFPVYYDTLGEGTRAYSIVGLPTTVIVDSEGNLYSSVTRAVDEDELRDAISEVLALKNSD
ncbi:MAG: TlpA disulfide reductase family protein [Oscillospiraceae bacterium]